MSKKELMQKINARKAKERVFEKGGLYCAKKNLFELYNYVEVGDDYSLREKALHAVREVIRWIKSVDKNFNVPYAWVY